MAISTGPDLMMLEGLRAASSEPKILYAKKGVAGLFPSSAKGKVAARSAIEQGYLTTTVESVPADGKRKSKKLEYGVLTARGRQFVLETDSPKVVLEALFRSLRDIAPLFAAVQATLARIAAPTESARLDLDNQRRSLSEQRAELGQSQARLDADSQALQARSEQLAQAEQACQALQEQLRLQGEQLAVHQKEQLQEAHRIRAELDAERKQLDQESQAILQRQGALGASEQRLQPPPPPPQPIATPTDSAKLDITPQQFIADQTQPASNRHRLTAFGQEVFYRAVDSPDRAAEASARAFATGLPPHHTTAASEHHLASRRAEKAGDRKAAACHAEMRDKHLVLANSQAPIPSIQPPPQRIATPESASVDVNAAVKMNPDGTDETGRIIDPDAYKAFYFKQRK